DDDITVSYYIIGSKANDHALQDVCDQHVAGSYVAGCPEVPPVTSTTGTLSLTVQNGYTATFTFEIFTDALLENDETVSVFLGSINGGALGQSSYVLTVEDVP